MKINPILVFVAAALLPSLPASAHLFNYAHEHPAACADAWEKKDAARSQCGSRAFCAAHGNDDRIAEMVCDPYVSKADRKRDTVILGGAWLDRARNLSDLESWTNCVGNDGRDLHPCAMLAHMRASTGTISDDLLPAGMKTASLALRAHISLGPFPLTIVRLGIGAGRAGMMDVTWKRDGKDPRETRAARLTPAEVDRLLAAVNRSDFWRLPRYGGHIGFPDGEWAAVELSVAGRRHHVHDLIGDAEAADLSILVNELTRMIKTRWRDAPA